MISFSSLEFSYNEQQWRPMRFPDALSTSDSPLLITGASGSGKTTLLHLIAGLLRPDKGEIWINGKDITKLKQQQIDRFRGQEIGLIFQKPHFFGSLNVMDNLLLAPYFSARKLDKDAVHRISERLHIEHLLKKSIKQISLGEQQRVSIARALVNRPSVVLADEPTSSLDDGNSQTVLRLLLDQSRLSNASLIVITHDQRLKPSFINSIQLS